VDLGTYKHIMVQRVTILCELQDELQQESRTLSCISLEPVIVGSAGNNSNSEIIWHVHFAQLHVPCPYFQIRLRRVYT
jgi:hypothetical protein